MLTERNLRKSVMARVKTILQSPPSGSGLSAFTVYSEAQLRQVQAKTLTLTRPCVFLVDSYVRPAEPALPLIVLETARVRQRPFEIGNRKGRRTEVICHVIGRMRAERDDLSSFLIDQMGASVPINDYTSSDSGTLIENAIVEDEIMFDPVELTRDDLRQEASLDHWAMCRFTLLTQN